MKTAPIPTFVQAFQLAGGFAFTQALSTFSKLGIPGILKDDSMTSDDIARACKAHPPALYRFLRFLSKIGVVELHGQRCRLTDVGQLLRPELPGSMAKGLEILNMEPWQQSWQHLLYSLQTGKPAFQEVYQQDPWAFFQQNPQYGIPFNEWMTTLSKMGAGAMLKSYDFPEEGTICDVGGGHGFLLRSILEARPLLEGILFDLPFVLRDADLGQVANRCKVVEGSFFEQIPAADLLILKSILHDWDDNSAIAILRNCAAAIRPGGKILVMDMLISDEAGITGYFYDIHMMVLLGGRERTVEEFQELFTSAGLQITQIIPTGSPQVVIEAATR